MFVMIWASNLCTFELPTLTSAQTTPPELELPTYWHALTRPPAAELPTYPLLKFHQLAVNFPQKSVWNFRSLMLL